MEFAWSNRKTHTRGSRTRRATQSGKQLMLESLESRMLLSGETTVITWEGQYFEASKDEYIVKAPLHYASAEALKATLLRKGLNVSKAVHLGSNLFAVINSSDSVAWVEQWNKAHPNFAVTPNFVYHKSATPTELTDATWQHLNTGQTIEEIEGLAGADIKTTQAWDLNTGSANVVIAIFDNGLDVENADLTGNIWVNPRENGTDEVDNDLNGVVDDLNGANFTTVLEDEPEINGDVAGEGHGNSVAMLIGARGNDDNAGLGVVWNVKLLPVVVFTDDDETVATDASIIAGLEYVMALKRRGVNITAINMSFGRRYVGHASGVGDTGNSGDPEVADLPAIMVFDAMGRAVGLGMVIITAAGNGGTDNDQFYFVPANFNHNLSITVAASNNLDTIEPTSNYGKNSVEIAAPGTAIDAGGEVVTGSSFAAALVTGAVALLKSISPAATAQQLVNAVLNGADRITALNPYVQLGRRLNVLRSAQIMIGNPRPQGWVDQWNSSSVLGWLYDQNLGPADIATQHLMGTLKINGVVVSQFTTDQVRNDLTPVLGSANHGFLVDFPMLGPGENLVEVYLNDVMVDSGGNYVTNPDGSFATREVLIGRRMVQGNVPPTGLVEEATARQFSGWALDPNAAEVPIQVRIDVDGETVAIIDAEESHPDVGDHGFVFTPTLSHGAHRVDFYAFDDYTGEQTLIGTRTVIGNKSLVYTNLEWDFQSRIISGYVVDPDSGFDPVSLQIVIDGQNGERQYLDARANLDVATDETDTYLSLISEPGDTKHRFEVAVPYVMAGNHQVRLFAYDNETGERTELLFDSDPLGDSAVFVNQLPTGLIRLVSEAQIEGYLQDPNSPDEPVMYRVDIDNGMGQVLIADQSVEGGNSGFTLEFPRMTAGTHTVTLWGIDRESYEMVQIATQEFEVADTGQVIGEVTSEVGNNAITGYATIPENDEEEPTFVDVYLVINGDIENPILTTVAQQGRRIDQETVVNDAFAFANRDIVDALGAGIFFAQVYAVAPPPPPEEPEEPEDPEEPPPPPEEPEEPVWVLLREGVIVINAEGEPTASGSLEDVNFVTLNGTARGAYTDETPTFVVDVNGTQFAVMDITTPIVPASDIIFSLETPHLPTVVGRTARLRYFNPVSGELLTVDQKNIPNTPVNNFVNGRMIVTGDFKPAGSLDVASATKIAGWVRDADHYGDAIQYRLDIGDSIGQLMTADVTRNDLPFDDKDHGFVVDTPLVPTGTHTVRLFAFDPLTRTLTMIGQRSFTVINEANRRPIGAVETLTATTIKGWIQDPTTPSSAVDIELRVNDVVVATVPADTARTDLVKRNGAFVRGFNFAMPGTVEPGRHYVEVYAVDTTDSSRKILLKAQSVEVGTPRIRGNIDLANYERIAGWVQGPANDVDEPLFRLDVNGQTYQTFVRAAETETTENGVQIRRFRFTPPPLPVLTNNTVSVYYIDQRTGESVLLATKVMGPIQSVIGWVDVVNSNVILGWALSPSLLTAMVNVQVYIDSVPVGATIAGLDRPDLTGMYDGHAFQFNVPQLAPGTHQVQVRFRDPITGEYSVAINREIMVA